MPWEEIDAQICARNCIACFALLGVRFDRCIRAISCRLVHQCSLNDVSLFRVASFAFAAEARFIPLPGRWTAALVTGLIALNAKRVVSTFRLQSIVGAGWPYIC